jgi:drug/metabolite transporter (DMT)-like permease
VKNYLKSSALLFAIAGFILYSSKAVFIKLAYDYSVDPVSLLLLRMLFSLPFYMGIWAYNRREWNNNPLTGKNKLWLIFLGLSGYYMASYLDFLGLQYITASLERLILFTYPTIVVLLSYFFLNKKLTLLQLLSILLTYAGLGIIFTGSGGILIGSRNEIITGVLLVFGSAVCYASFLTGSNYLVTHLGSKRLTTQSMLISVAAVVIHYIFSGSYNLFHLPLPVYIYGFLMAVFATVIPSYLINEAIKQLGASTISIVGSIGPVSTIVLSVLILGEALTFTQGIGTFVIISGIIVISQHKR